MFCAVCCYCSVVTGPQADRYVPLSAAGVANRFMVPIMTQDGALVYLPLLI